MRKTMQLLAISLILLISVLLAACSAVAEEPAVVIPDIVEEGAVADVATDGAGNDAAVAEQSAETVAEPAIPVLPVLGSAPQIENDTWLNTDGPITLAEHEGQVVMVHFWTFGCINCKRTLGYVDEWYAEYGGEDFEIISVHYPEFDYERDINNVSNFLLENDIQYPVAIDNNRQTWAAWSQRYWPTRYLIDRDGNIRYKHIGEGAYEETEEFIQTLIAEENS